MTSEIRRGTTPTFYFEVDYDLTDWDCYVTFKQYELEITERQPIIYPTEDGCVVVVNLTQEQTLQFKTGTGNVQIRACKDDIAVASQIYDFKVNGILLFPGEIPRS